MGSSHSILSASDLLDLYRSVHQSSQTAVPPATSFHRASFGEVELFEIESRGPIESSPEDMLIYAIRTKKGLFVLREPYSSVMYGQKASSIVGGQLLEGYDSVIYISPTTMGDCGSFLLINSEGNPLEVPIRCAALGC